MQIARRHENVCAGLVLLALGALLALFAALPAPRAYAVPSVEEAQAQLDAAEASMERLSKFSATEDGFEIAELDLQTRGAGNLEGNEQSGAWVFRWFDWIADQELISQTLETAEHILKDSSAFDESAREKIQAWYGEKDFVNEDGVH